MSAPALSAPAATVVAGASGELRRALSLVAVVALVSGNMMGTSIYTLPASLAGITGPLGMLAWIITAAGYYFVAVVYARLGSRYPRSGGPYVYAREAFGDFAAFLTVWSYWVSAVIGNAAIVTGVVGYMVGLFAPLAGSVVAQFLLAQALLWSLCWLNVRGVRESASLQTVVMVVTVIPLVAIGLGSLRAFDAANLVPFAPRGYGSLAAGAALVVWAYSGVESATVPAEEVQAPEETIRRGTMLGYSLGTMVYLLVALAAVGVVPNAELATSPRPLAVMAERALGSWAGLVMAFAAIVGGLGTLNGWTLMAGRIPLSAARDGLFFPAMARIHPERGTPHRALVLGTVVSSLMCLLYFSRTLLGVFNFVVLLAVLTTLLPHLFAAAAELLLVRRDPGRFAPAERRRTQVIAVIAFAFLLYTVYGAGADVVMWGFLVILGGMPLYVWLRTAPRRG